MKYLVFGTYFFLVSEVFAFPKVLSWQNKPILAYENNKQAVLVKNVLIKSPFAVITANKDQLEFNINHKDQVTVYEKSKIQVVDFLNETGFVENLYILDGQIRFNSTHRDSLKTQTAVVLHTPFFELKMNSLVDVIFSLNMKAPSIEIKVINGSLPLEFFAYEQKINLNAGESVLFKGELADDALTIKYDYLLDKRKAPRGSLALVKKFDQSAFVLAEKKATELIIKNKQNLKNIELEKKRKQKVYEDSFLCKAPFGQKNQCAWIAKNSKCFRQRCNVSGLWSDVIERPLNNACTNTYFVAECDY